MKITDVRTSRLLLIFPQISKNIKFTKIHNPSHNSVRSTPVASLPAESVPWSQETG